MSITITNRLHLEDPHPELVDIIIPRFTIDNPVYIENAKMNRWNGETPRYLEYYEWADKNLILPRGAARQVMALCRREGFGFELIDERRSLPEIEFTFHGDLRPFQQAAVEDVLSRDFGTLSAPTGAGKTVMALWVISARRQPALIIVHTKELLHQWRSRIQTFLHIPLEEIGQIGDGKKIVGEKVTVAIVNTLYKCSSNISPHIGYLIVDECHRTPSRTFTEAVSAFHSKFMTGLSATPWRRDKLSKLIFWYIGDVVHQVEKEDLIKTGDVLPAEVIWRKTHFQTRFNPSEEYTKMLSELTEDPDRNAIIAADMAREAANGGGICIALSDRKSHCKKLAQILEIDHQILAPVLTGDTPKKDRQEIVKNLTNGRYKALIATGQLIGEGFDCKELSTMFLATPIKFNGRVIQYLGRVLRPAPGKEKARIFDYVDVRIPVLKASAKARSRVYAKG